jgi:3-oxoacyl-[acyl-carrier-protein] synthase-3
LGLRPDCFTNSIEGACNAFILQIELARRMIGTSDARYALLVQTCNISPILPVGEPHSPWFGDACTAVVLGPVAGDHGVLGAAHATDGRYYGAIIAGVPGGVWYGPGDLRLYSQDSLAAVRSFLDIPDKAAEVSAMALQRSGCVMTDVSFYAPHQPTSWFRRVTQEHLGLEHARTIDTFPWAASASAANIPLGLSVAEREGLLVPGDVVLMFAGGAGLSYSSMVMRWGR